MRSRWCALFLAGLVTAANIQAAPSCAFVDCSRAELVKAVPELSALTFDDDQNKLEPLLAETGKQVSALLKNVINVSIAEDVHEMRFNGAQHLWQEHTDQFRYVVQLYPFAELRREPNSTEPLKADTKSIFLVSGQFMGMLGVLDQDNLARTRFRYLGRILENGEPALLLAYRELDGGRQGLAWIGESTKHVLRLRTDVLKAPEGSRYDSFSRDVRYIGVKFAALDVTPWLVSSATVDVQFPAGELHSVHRFSDYKLDGFEQDQTAAELKEDTGEPLGPAKPVDDEIELLLRNRAASPEGKQPAAEDVTIKVDVRQVLVPVVVTDKEGHHVTGLKQTDFQIFEDGAEQKITAFASERADISPPANPGSAPAAPAQETPKPLAQRQAFIICVDTMHASFGNFVYVRQALQKLFQQEQPGGSQYALMALGKSMQIVQNTTSDPAKILEAIASGGFQKTYQGQKFQATAQLADFERELGAVRELCDEKDPSCDSRKQQLPSLAGILENEEEQDTVQFLGELQSVVEQLARGSGRRTLILISDGFATTPGKAAFGLLAAYFPEFRSTRAIERIQYALEPIFRAAARGNVPVDTIDSRGLYTSPVFDVSRHGFSAVTPQVNRQLDEMASANGDTLSEIASATGGTAFHNSNDLLAGLKRAFADGREYYMLAYVSTNSAQDGKFRKIDVKVPNSKALVNAKRGYWASTP